MIDTTSLNHGVSYYPNRLNSPFLVLSVIQMEPLDESLKGKGTFIFSSGEDLQKYKGSHGDPMSQKEKNCLSRISYYQNHKHCKICEELHMINRKKVHMINKDKVLFELSVFLF